MARGDERGGSRDADAAGGEMWAPIAYLLAGLLSILVLIAALPGEPRPAPTDPGAFDEIQRLIEGQASPMQHWRAALRQLCSDPLLQAEGIAPDCSSGTITFGDDLFDDSGEVQLTEEGIRKLHLAISALLRNLRANDAVWENIESIELRGHADPLARRDPYVTNMRVSQKRPLAIMFYLISDWALSQRDRDDLEDLLVLSAASHSRPPESCPERTRACYPYWRRVEITPRLKTTMAVDHVNRFLDSLSDLLRGDG